VLPHQETKLSRADLDRELALVPGWDSFFCCCRARSGYSGVVTFCRTQLAPTAAEEGFTGTLPASSGGSGCSVGPQGEMLYATFDRHRLCTLDSEGRCVMTLHGDNVVLVNVYIPALSMDDPQRVQFKADFLTALHLRLHALRAAGRKVILLGDLNCCPYAIDSSSTDPPRRAGATTPSASTTWLRELLRHGEGGGCFVDVFRHLHPTQQGAYTCFNAASGAALVRTAFVLTPPSPHMAGSGSVVTRALLGG
jgi:AP endonuclease-2